MAQFYCDAELEQLYFQQYQAWPNQVELDVFRMEIEKQNRPVPTSVPKENRVTFAQAIETAFWDNGGPELLANLAAKDPTEFLRLCAKLIPSDTKGPNGEPLVNITVQTLPPHKVEKPINE